MLASLPLFVFPFCMLAAAISDARSFIIPNTLSIILFFGFFVAFAVSGLDLQTLGMHLLVSAVVLAIGIALFAFKLLGAGDGKLLAAVGLWLGWPTMVKGLFYIVFAGGALCTLIALVWLLMRWYPSIAGRSKLLTEMSAKPLRGLPAPYGIGIAIGAILAFPQSEIFRAIMGTSL